MSETIGSDEVRVLVRDLGRVPPELRRQLGATLRKLAQPIVSDARRRASWSTRIPAAISASARFTGRRPGVSIRVSHTKAPHGRAYEGLLNPGGMFRHPVYGHMGRWVTQHTRPFLLPAVHRYERQVLPDMAEAVDLSARLHGWK